jgi:hypothetical protein
LEARAVSVVEKGAIAVWEGRIQMTKEGDQLELAPIVDEGG